MTKTETGGRPVRPIILTTPLVLALEDPLHPKRQARSIARDRRAMRSRPHDGHGRRRVIGHQMSLPTMAVPRLGDPGSLLWVREAFAWDGERLVYAADGAPAGRRMQSPVLMPWRFSRILLRVTGVHEETLQSITEQDALDEGVLVLGRKWILECNALLAMRCAELYGQAASLLHDGQLARATFAVLWDMVGNHRRFGWNSNPRVIVTRFEVERRLSAREVLASIGSCVG